MGSDPLSAWWLGLAPATLEFWVRFPNERNQGKQAHPVLKYRVPHGSQGGGIAVMTSRRRRRPPGGQTTAAGSGRRRAPFSTDNLSHTHTARSLACPLLTLSSPARSFPNGIFRYDGAPCGRPLLPCSDRSAGQRNQPSHSTVLARPVRLFSLVPLVECVQISFGTSFGFQNLPTKKLVLL